MARFIPRDNNRAEKLAEQLGSTIFKDVGTFVEYYNSGIINKNNDDTKETVKEIIETFKDVKEKRGKLTFISEDEVLVDEALADLSRWTTLTRVRREMHDLVTEGSLKSEDTIVFAIDGAFYKVDENVETGETVFVPLGADKLKNSEVELLATYADSEIDEGYIINVQTLINFDGSFIKQVKELIPSI